MPNYIISVGDKTIAFKEIFYSFYPSLCRFAASVISDTAQSEDVVQELFVKIHSQNLSFPNMISLKSFLYVSVRNRCVDVLRGRTTKPPHSQIDEISDDHFIDEQGLLDSVAREECYRIIESGIATLAPQSRTVMTLVLEGKSIQDIAARLNVSPNTVKTLKSRAIAMLRSKFGTFFSILLSSFF
ncbi:MAG: sigma-70 family RNA polymerase sigma factor [Bacteroidales bacterium]|nr:sigma-70 family RNA polymerase sigma factor [Bacteroidales bacterium]